MKVFMKEGALSGYRRLPPSNDIDSNLFEKLDLDNLRETITYGSMRISRGGSSGLLDDTVDIETA